MFFDPQFLEAMYICMGFVPWELLLYNWMKRCYYVPSFPRVYFSLRPFNLHKTIPHFQPNETCDQAFHRGSKQKRRVCFDLQFYILQFNCASHSAFFIIAFSFSGSLLGSLLKCFFFFLIALLRYNSHYTMKFTQWNVLSILTKVYNHHHCLILEHFHHLSSNLNKITLVGWRHWLNGHEFEKTQGDSEGQGSLACCSSWGRKELDTT